MLCCLRPYPAPRGVLPPPLPCPPWCLACAPPLPRVVCCLRPFPALRAVLPADLSLGDFQQYAVLGSLIFIYANMVWAGLVRPILMIVVNLWYPVKSYSSWTLMMWALLITALIPAFIAIDYYRTAVRFY